MKKNNSLKVLFVYPNIEMRTIPPLGIASMTALLKENNHIVDVFDGTRYLGYYTNPDQDYDSSHEKFNRMDTHKDRVKNNNVLDFDWAERGITLKSSNIFIDFKEKIEDFGPDLIAFSIVENTYDLGLQLLNRVPNSIPVVMGGVFPTYAPEICISEPKVTFVARGEGEFPMLDLCNAIANGDSLKNIMNVWYKNKDGDIFRNQLRPATNLADLPIPDYTIFEDALFYTPMQGKVWKIVGFETQRGCPYTCTYCNSPSNNYTYRAENAGNFYRKKSIPHLKKELDHLVKNYRPELIFFIADTFLAMSSRELDEFSEFYQSYKIPFWMNTRAETIDEHSAEHLAKMNCLRFNIGIEHGNEEYRKSMLKRPVTNAKTIRSFEIAAEYSEEYLCVANSIIGLPEETPELIMDTIELNRNLPDEIVAAGCFIFAPYWGTPLRQIAIDKGYMSKDLICTGTSNTSGSSVLDMPQLSVKEIDGFMRTFSFYVKFPKDRWKDIDIARSFDKKGNAMFEKLKDEYSEKYLNPIGLMEGFVFEKEEELLC